MPSSLWSWLLRSIYKRLSNLRSAVSARWERLKESLSGFFKSQRKELQTSGSRSENPLLTCLRQLGYTILVAALLPVAALLRQLQIRPLSPPASLGRATRHGWHPSMTTLGLPVLE